MSIGIVTDTAADLAIRTMLEHGIAYVNHSIVVDNLARRDWRDLDPDKLYAILQNTQTPPQLRPASKNDFKTVYSNFLEQHQHLISIHVSNQMSGTIKHAFAARKELRFEDRVTIVDSKTISIALAEIVLEANKLAKQDEPIEQILWAIEHIQHSSSLYFVPDSIKWLANRKSTKSSSIIDSFQGQCPVFNLSNGKLQKLANLHKSQVKEYISKSLVAEYTDKPIHFALAYAGDDRAVIEGLKRHFEFSGLEIIRARTQKMGSLLGLMLGPKSISVYAHKSLGACLKF
ncbi:MAG TPA: DegV family EDD domain-containing protein [Trueperaceae bacterium]|nr:DegV family EDD domain-containing protein [Trueperaceae bacterium]